MKTVQLILSIIGLVSIALAYRTGQVAYLIVALASFVVGLYYMGAIGRRTSTKDQEDTAPKKAGNAKDKSQNKP